ncbi:hypothetical protein M427DRAFT_135562 [Gonapodya prolifera JEL478]|uniref:Uncharacterized protein n=1 Tax=Gonapodya prolifera (strain JEL478) TaxID=1344416 RepID=A0A139ADJ6_GONPJ|nr:hypothetical protein M427DRAFT_135562 [Gonapodya prolifera JEL478]|eukprot:KXS14892.1 hypothetical protein M427DRAFT_135562 [Gonapodya prolifera JEL478]
MLPGGKGVAALKQLRPSVDAFHLFSAEKLTQMRANPGDLAAMANTITKAKQSSAAFKSMDTIAKKRPAMLSRAVSLRAEELYPTIEALIDQYVHLSADQLDVEEREAEDEKEEMEDNFIRSSQLSGLHSTRKADVEDDAISEGESNEEGPLFGDFTSVRQGITSVECELEEREAGEGSEVGDIAGSGEEESQMEEDAEESGEEVDSVARSGTRGRAQNRSRKRQVSPSGSVATSTSQKRAKSTRSSPYQD